MSIELLNRRRKALQAKEDIKALKFTNVGTASANISMSNNGGNQPLLYYSYDGVNETQWNYSALTLDPGESVYIRGNNPNGLSSGVSLYSKFVMSSGRISCQGNIMTLLGEDILTIPNSYCFVTLFSGCTSLVDAPELPATGLSEQCYRYMFHGCTSLVNAPELPATSLKEYCYLGMFYQCASLVNAPGLPAMILKNNCYQYMFYQCAELIQAPELLAPVLVSNGYSSMFRGCQKLNYIKCMAETLGSTSYRSEWVSEVGKNGTFVKKAGVEWSTGINGIPPGWSVVEI